MLFTTHTLVGVVFAVAGLALVAYREVTHYRERAAAIEALADQALQTKLRALGAEPAAPDRNMEDHLQAFFAKERGKWGTVIRKAHIRLE